MICPRCMQDNTSAVGISHYICNNEFCVDENNRRTQFTCTIDEDINFPYNVIFSNRTKQEFYRKSYLIPKPVGSSSI